MRRSRLPSLKGESSGERMCAGRPLRREGFMYFTLLELRERRKAPPSSRASRPDKRAVSGI